MTLARWVSLSVVVVSVLVAGCSGKVVGTDLTRQPSPTEPTEPAEPNPLDEPPKCASVVATCDAGDVSFASDEACGESAVEYCYSRSGACGTKKIWCGHLRTAECDGYPSCEPGDRRVGDASECFQNPPLSCYSRTVCGVTITCARP